MKIKNIYNFIKMFIHVAIILLRLYRETFATTDRYETINLDVIITEINIRLKYATILIRAIYCKRIVTNILFFTFRTRICVQKYFIPEKKIAKAKKLILCRLIIF